MLKYITASLFLFLGGCTTSELVKDSRRGLAPQSESLIKSSEYVGATSKSPILLRIFKETSELELWRKNHNNVYVLVKVYDICTFSGNLGPKLKQGDKQSPEGFYNIKPDQMNYNSSQFLSFNTGFPNDYDKFHKRTGSYLMVHGGCSSSGCYAIQDAPMQELFTAMRDSFKAGQKEIQLHIYPFRMNNWNLYTHKSNKNLDFWLQLKYGYDIFNETKKDLQIKILNGKYVVQ